MNKILLAAVIAALPFLAQAEQNEKIELAPVEVKAKHINNEFPDSASTATKTDTPIKETPFSVQVVNEALIQELSLTHPNDLANVVSGVQPVVGYGNTPSQYFIVRGFTNFGVNFRNGYRVAEPYTPHDLANVERVEFLKGPASVLYGQSQPGGAVNTVTKVPVNYDITRLNVSAGSFDTYGTTIDFNRVIGDFSFRLNAAADKADSYIDLERSRNWLLAPSVKWKINENTTLIYEAEFQKTTLNGFSNGLPNLPEIKRADFNTTLAEPWNNLQNRNTSHRLEFNSALSDAVEFRQGLYYAHTDRSINTVSPSFAGDPIADGQTFANVSRVAYSQKKDNPTNKVSQSELTGKFKLGPTDHTVLGGFELSKAIFDFAGSFDPLDSVDLNTYQPGSVPEINVPASFGARNEARSRAFYLQDQISWNNWRFLAGLRNERVNSSATDTIADTKASQSESATTGRFGLLYMWTPVTSTYYSYSESFVPNLGRNADGGIFKAEQGSQHEIGIKHTLLPGLEATAAIFDIRKKNVQTSDPNDPTFSITNGEQRSRGGEASLAGQVTSNVKVIANLSQLNAKVTKDSEPATQGARLFGVPKFSGNVWGLANLPIDIPGRVSVGLGVIRVGQREASQPNLSYFKLPSYTRYDAGVFYKVAKYSVDLNLRNISNEKILNSLEGVATQIQAPFNWTLNVGVDF